MEEARRYDREWGLWKIQRLCKAVESDERSTCSRLKIRWISRLGSLWVTPVHVKSGRLFCDAVHPIRQDCTNISGRNVKPSRSSCFGTHLALPLVGSKLDRRLKHFHLLIDMTTKTTKTTAPKVGRPARWYAFAPLHAKKEQLFVLWFRILSTRIRKFSIGFCKHWNSIEIV